MDELCALYQAIDGHFDNAEEKQAALKQALRKSYDLLTSNGTCTLETTITSCGLSPGSICQDKHVRQVYKLGRYWGLCVDMANAARKFRFLFQTMSLEYIQQYEPTTSSISKSTNKTFVECYVHAEIQILLYHDSHPSIGYLKPRVLGVSKSACYLCNIFILEHRDFFITKTHGRLYDQWALPDLAEYSPEHRQKYRRILAAMDIGMQTAIRRQPYFKRKYPLGSWISLPTPPLASPTASDTGTLLSRDSRTQSTRSKTPVATASVSTSHPLDTSSSQFPSHTIPDGSAQSTPRPLSSLSLPPPSPSSQLPLPSQIPPPAPSPPTPLSSDPQPPAEDNQIPISPPLQPLPRGYTSHPTSQSDPPSPETPTTPRALSQHPHAASDHTSLPSQSPSPSTTSINLANLPTTKTITPTRSLRISSEGLSTTIEIEQPSSARVKILDPLHNEPEQRHVVDVDALPPDETLVLVKEEGASKIMLLLHRNNRRGVQLELAWT